MLVLSSDSTEIIIQAGDLAVKIPPNTQYRTAHTSKNQTATAIEL